MLGGAEGVGTPVALPRCLSVWPSVLSVALPLPSHSSSDMFGTGAGVSRSRRPAVKFNSLLTVSGKHTDETAHMQQHKHPKGFLVGS